MSKNKKPGSPSSSTNPGVTVHANDGRLFFLPDAVARQTAIPSNGLYMAFHLLTRRGLGNMPIEAEKKGFTACVKEILWLEQNNPNTDEWRDRCFKFFDDCASQLTNVGI